MPKFAHSDVFDNGLLLIKNNGNAQHLCSAYPNSRAEALAYSLASVAMASTDFTVANGDVSGRKITMAQKSGTVAANGTAIYAVVIDGTRVLVVTSASPQQLTLGNPVTFPAWDYEMRQPT
jgi:hypothetical protein